MGLKYVGVYQVDVDWAECAPATGHMRMVRNFIRNKKNIEKK